MALRVYRPTTPGRRRTSVSTFEEITQKRPERSLRVMKKQYGGRNMHGRITVRHRGGGAKRYLRIVDFRCDRFDVPAKIQSIEYDPNRSARIALAVYRDGVKRYIIAPHGLDVGATVLSSQKKIKAEVGNRMPLEYIPVGMEIYNVELIPSSGGKLARSAGTLIKLLSVDGAYAQLKLPSGEIRMVLKKCLATVGAVGNKDHIHVRYGKAGRMRHRGIRPTVRGKAMNPVDHPHGGGEGRNPIGLKYPKTPWGKHALGVKTRRNKRTARFILKSRGRKRR